jgi:membrane protease YdiL (CAAX protease family)
MVSATLYGELGVQQLLQRVAVRHNVSLWIWLLAPWLSGLLLLAVWRANDGKDHPFQWNDLTPRIIPALAYGVITALAEEIGWRGFLLPKLLRQLPPLRAALVSGFIIAIWNALPYFLGVPTAGRAAGAVLGPVPVLSLIPLAVVQGYLYQQSRGSLTLASAFSMSSAAAYAVCSLPLFDGTEESRLYYSVLEVLACNMIALPAFALLQFSTARLKGDIAEFDDLAHVESTASKKNQ